MTEFYHQSLTRNFVTKFYDEILPRFFTRKICNEILRQCLHNVKEKIFVHDVNTILLMSQLGCKI